MKTKRTNKLLVLVISLMMIVTLLAGLSITASAEETGTETNTPIAEFVGKQVNLGGDISMKFHVRNNEDRPIESITVEVEFLGKLTYLTECEKHPTEDKVYIYTFEGINPQCLGDLMNVTILVGGSPVGHENAVLTGYSVKENLINAYNITNDANMKQLIIDTLEYGAAAQVYRNYKTDALVTKDVAFLSEGKTEVDVPRSSPVVNETVADSIKEATVNFSATNFIKVSYNDGEIKTLTSDAVAAYDFAKKMQFSADGLFTLGYSVNDYCYDVINSEKTSEEMKNLAKALYNYGLSAHIVEGNHEGGTATCVAQAVCTICGNGYGDLAPENHDFGSGNTCICGAEIAFTGIVVDDENSDEYRYDETSKTYTIIIPADEVGGTGYLSYDIIGTNLTLIEDTNTLLKVQHENEDGLTSAPDDLLVDVLQDNGNFGWSVLGYRDGEWEKLLYSNDGGMTWTTYTFEVKQAYSITVNASQNGTVTANEYAIEGDNIALNVSPAEGYMLDTLSVTDASGNTMVVENNQFTMPASTVTVNATFAVCDHKDSRHETATDNDDGTHSFTCTVCGVTGSETHTLTYTANGNIITESCSIDCGHTGTATISATDATYDGLEHNTAIVDYSEGWKGGELTISYANNTNAGTATASITVGEATATVDFAIAKAPLTVTADAKIKSYGDENPTLTYTAEGLLGGDTLTGALTGALSREEGENVGSYAITLGTLSADNYTISFEGADFTIQAKEVTNPTVTLDQTSYQYDGNVKEPKVTSIVVDGRTLTEGIDYTVSYDNNVYVGNYATVVINFMSNYDGTFRKWFTITQNPDTTEFDGEWVTVPKE